MPFINRIVRSEEPNWGFPYNKPQLGYPYPGEAIRYPSEKANYPDGTTLFKKRPQFNPMLKMRQDVPNMGHSLTKPGLTEMLKRLLQHGKSENQYKEGYTELKEDLSWRNQPTNQS